MSDKTLTATEDEEINKVFEKIGCNYRKVKSDFKTRFSTLQSEDERRLILDLTKRFIFIPLSDYAIHLQSSVNQFIRSIKSNNRIVVMNGLSRCDFGKVKSNYLVSYQFKGLNLVQNLNWGNKIPKVLDDVKSLLQYKDTKTLELLLVDDFIGSGETIEGAYNYITNRLKVHKKGIPHVSVVCIVAMQQAVDLLNKMGIKVYASKITKRGISDYYSGSDLSKAISLMKDIETRIKVKSKYQFGYKQSEALVCMERCPNNTFPFFWFGLKYGNPPFRR